MRSEWGLACRDQHRFAVSGPYNIPNVATEVVGIFTNRTPTGPYRGAGHPEATFLLERMVDELARELATIPPRFGG